jgi:hypothetical protein
MYTYPILVWACTTIHIIWDLGDSGSACHILNAKSYLCSWNGPKLVGSFFSFTFIIMKLSGSLLTFNTIHYVLGAWCLGAGYSLQWGQSEPAATNAPVGRSVHGMGCIFSFGAIWGSSQSIFFHCRSLYLIYFCLFLTIFSLDVTSHIATLLMFLLS